MAPPAGTRLAECGDLSVLPAWMRPLMRSGVMPAGIRISSSSAVPWAGWRRGAPAARHTCAAAGCHRRAFELLERGQQLLAFFDVTGVAHEHGHDGLAVELLVDPGRGRRNAVHHDDREFCGGLRDLLVKRVQSAHSDSTRYRHHKSAVPRNRAGIQCRLDAEVSATAAQSQKNRVFLSSRARLPSEVTWSWSARCRRRRSGAKVTETATERGPAPSWTQIQARRRGRTASHGRHRPACTRCARCALGST
jgi:hypothetical protein